MGREISISRLFFISKIIFLGVLLAHGVQDVNAASWHQNSFDDRQVTYVKTNSMNTDQIVVIADNQLYISGDGGIFWNLSISPQPPVMVAFDPVRRGSLYVGTNRGLFYSSDFGLTWQPFGSSEMNLLITVGLTTDDDYIYASMYRGTGTQYRLYRVNRSGGTELLSFTGRAGYLVAAQNQLYMGNGDGVFKSLDSGSSWMHIGVVPNVGPNTTRITVRDNNIWQLASSGLFKSADGGLTWAQQHSKNNLVEHNASDRRFSGLVVNRGKAFFGASSTSRGTKDLVRQEGDILDRLELGMKVNDLMASKNKLWVATDDGLWVNTELVGVEGEVKRPVIIIPGILGSWQKGGKWVLDPITHLYDSLWQGLLSHGFEENKTLFAFPYQWRQSNIVSAQQLDLRISEAKSVCSCPKVDLVGHSMGGLVARQYIQSDYYDGDVENLIQLGTPNQGSPNSYITWESGDLQQPLIQEVIANLVFRIEAAERGRLTLTRYIQEHVETVREMLPTYDYLVGRKYPLGYPRNTFLEYLNKPEGIAKLRTRVQLHILGSERQNTLVGMKVGDPNLNDLRWKEGKPELKYYGPGDGTVPITSLEILRPRNFHMSSDHGGMVTEAKDIIPIRLMGGFNGANMSESRIRNLLMVYVLSPVRIEVISPSGRTVNDTINEIQQSFFTGSNAEVQFVTIPRPESGEFKINITGKDEGNYVLGVAIAEEGISDVRITELASTSFEGMRESYLFDLGSHKLSPAPSLDGMNESNSPTQAISLDAHKIVNGSSISQGITGLRRSGMRKTNIGALINQADTPVRHDNIRMPLLLLMLWSAILALALWDLTRNSKNI